MAMNEAFVGQKWTGTDGTGYPIKWFGADGVTELPVENVTAQSSDETKSAIRLSADFKTVEQVTAMGEGDSQVSVSADAQTGEGVKMIVIIEDIRVKPRPVPLAEIGKIGDGSGFGAAID